MFSFTDVKTDGAFVVYTIVNNMDFSKRLEHFLNLYDLSAATLAEKIDINRSTISHLLSGRNKPSLDLIIKLHEKFPDIDLEWWIYGKGNFNQQENDNKELPVPKEQSEQHIPEREHEEKKRHIPSLKTNTSKKIERILILYEDGSFEDYRNG